MSEMLGAMYFVIILFTILAIILYFALRTDSNETHVSKYILNKFEPDNTAPKITDMVEFHRTNIHSKYKID